MPDILKSEPTSPKPKPQPVGIEFTNIQGQCKVLKRVLNPKRRDFAECYRNTQKKGKASITFDAVVSQKTLRLRNGKPSSPLAQCMMGVTIKSPDDTCHSKVTVSFGPPKKTKPEPAIEDDPRSSPYEKALARCFKGQSKNCNKVAEFALKDRSKSIEVQGCEIDSSIGCENRFYDAFDKACDKDKQPYVCEWLAIRASDRYRRSNKDSWKDSAIKRGKLACRLGRHSGCAIAGSIIYKTDKTAGRQLLKRGCAKKNGESCVALGATESETGKQLPHFKKGCDYGFATGCDLEAKLTCKDMNDTTPACMKAKERSMAGHVSQCRKDGILESCTTVAFRHYKGLGDKSKAMEFAKHACEQREAEACVLGAQIALDGKDLAGAHTFFKKGCRAKSGQACLRLGISLWSGEGVKKDPVRAMIALQDACRHGEAEGCNLRAWWACTEMNQCDANAQSAARKAVKLDPTAAAYRDTLGEVLCRRGQDGANETFKQACASGSKAACSKACKGNKVVKSK